MPNESVVAHAPITAATPVRYRDAKPDKVDVVIIGGGVIGVTAALYLNRLGLRAFICEKGRVAGEQSSRNWGWIRQLGRDEAELPVMVEASRLWADLEAESGGRTGFQRSGILYLSSTQKDLEQQAAWLEIARRHDVDVRPVDGPGVAKLVDTGSAGKRWVGGLWSPGDARAEPWQAVPAIMDLARSEGVGVRENCAARGLEISAGRLVGVHTEEGLIECDQAVVAGGVWSSLFLRRHGVLIPQLSVRSSVARTVAMPDIGSCAAVDEDLAFRRRADGGYTVSALGSHDLYVGPDAFRHLRAWLPLAARSLGETRFRITAPKHYPDGWGTARRWRVEEESPFERCRVLEPAPERGRTDLLKRRFAVRFPDLGEPEISHEWAGMIDAMPDVVPVVDRAPSVEGLIIATGMSGHGFGIGPGFGKAVAHIAAGKPVGHDLHRFRFSRFTDGSKLVPGPSL